MTQEEKQLLLKDLCARLPYGVKCRQHKLDSQVCTMHPEYLKNAEDVEEYEPYLRPMSSVTEEEKKIMRSYGFGLIPYDTGYTGFANIENYIDEVSFSFMEEFLNAHHFDYRGLIEKGLALEAKEGMYKG